MKLNQKNFDGSVSSYCDTKKPGTGYYVPFNHSDFKNQIEPNILESVLLLNSKGYHTVTSCQGHSIFDFVFRKGLRFNLGPHITIKLENKNKKLSSFMISSSINYTMPTDSNYIKIKVRTPFSMILPNTWLCKIIEKFCRNLEHA